MVLETLVTTVGLFGSELKSIRRKLSLLQVFDIMLMKINWEKIMIGTQMVFRAIHMRLSWEKGYYKMGIVVFDSMVEMTIYKKLFE